MWSIQQVLILVGLFVIAAIITAVTFKRFKGFAVGFGGMNLFGLGYVGYVLITLRHSGWADLISLVAAFYAFGLGLVLGIVSEVGIRLYHRLNHK